MSSRSTSWNAYQEPMSPGIDDTTTSITVADASNLVAPYGYLVLDPDNPSLREYVRVTNVVGNVLTVQRGLDGSAGAGASAHGDNAPVRAVSVGQWLDDIFDDIEALEALQDDYLLIDGTRAMAGNLDMGGNQINDLAMAPGPLDSDAANVGYVNDQDALYLPLVAGVPNPLTGALHIDAGLPQEGVYSISQIEIGRDNDAGDVGRSSFIDMGAGGANDYDVRLIATDGQIGSIGEGQLAIEALKTTIPNGILTDSGSAANPPYAFDPLANTGMYYDGGNRLGFATNGVATAKVIPTGLDLLSNKLLNVADGTVVTDGVNFDQVRVQPSFTGATITAPWAGTVNFRRQTNMVTLTVSIARTLTTINGPFTIISAIPLEYQNSGATVYFTARVQFTTGVDASVYKYAQCQMAAGNSFITVETRIDQTTDLKFTATYIGNGV